jgi:7,8-dihydropterin-6-yl-methyl-4-(beta-D-ribofuranosyl)aminobenzene 5'-phosphate synthase
MYSILRVSSLSRTLQNAAILLSMVTLCSMSAKAAGGSIPLHAARTLKITVLVTNLAGDPYLGDGEWGYSALVEVDGHKILYDTGASSEMVLHNANSLHIDLSDVEDVVLSHNHRDHVGGLITLRRELSKINPRAMSRVHVGAGIFEPRLNEANEDQNGLRSIKAEYLATGGSFITHEKATELYPGVWLTGPVPRPNAEKNWFPGLSMMSAQGRSEDNVPEDSALVFDTTRGIVILTGCGHAGIVNIAEYARSIASSRPLLAVIGGLHLFNASDQALVRTGGKLKGYRIENLLAGHCTGIEATYRLRKLAGLTRTTAVVSAVGSSFTLSAGIQPRMLAQ